MFFFRSKIEIKTIISLHRRIHNCDHCSSTLTAKRGQFVVSKWTVLDSVTHPLFVDTSSVCAAVLMTSTR